MLFPISEICLMLSNPVSTPPIINKTGRGLLSILQNIVNNKSSSEIIDIDGMKILKEIGIGNSITSQRMNGFLSALETIKSLVVRYERD